MPVFVAPVDTYPHAFIHAFICSISLPWPAMISAPNRTSSGCLDPASIFAMSTAPWWCGIIHSRNALSRASPVFPASILLISAILIDIGSWDISWTDWVWYLSQPTISGILWQCSAIFSLFHSCCSIIIPSRREYPSRSHWPWVPIVIPAIKAATTRPTAIAIRRAAPQLHQLLWHDGDLLQHAFPLHSHGSHLQSTQAQDSVFLVTIKRKERK